MVARMYSRPGSGGSHTTTMTQTKNNNVKKTNLAGKTLQTQREAEQRDEKRKEVAADNRLAKAIADRNRPKNGKRGHNIQNEVDLYVRQLLNPFENLNAVVPDVHAYPTTTFSVSTPVLLKSDASGRACLFVRDGITMHYIQNNDAAYTGGMIYSSGWQLQTASGGAWQPGVKQSAVRSAFAAYRPVAMGARLTYSGAPVDAAGRIAMGYFPGSVPFPSAISADVSGPLTFDDFSQFQEVITGSAINGATVVWKPMTPQNHFRPTKPTVFDAFSDAYENITYTSDSGASNCTWDIDPEAFPAVQAIGLAAKDDSATVNTPEVAAKLMSTSLPLNSPCLTFLMEGLPASTECFAGEIVVHYEGVADNRSFSLVQSSSRTARPDSIHKAIARVSQVHPAHSGGTIQSHDSWMDQALRITGQVANVANAVTGVVSMAPKVVTPLLEAAETLAAII